MRSKNSDTFSAIRDAVRRYTETEGEMPTVRTIAAQTGISRATVQRYLTALSETGELERDRRGRITTPSLSKMRNDTTPVALVGEIACGLPCYAEENIEAYYRLPTELVGGGECFLLRAKGESMIEAGIDDGDLVLVRRQSYARRGDVAVVLAGEETTLKRYYPEPEHHCVRLHPENRTMPDIYLPDCIVQGVALKVIKDL